MALLEIGRRTNVGEQETSAIAYITRVNKQTLMGLNARISRAEKSKKETSIFNIRYDGRNYQALDSEGRPTDKTISAEDFYKITNNFLVAQGKNNALASTTIMQERQSANGQHIIETTWVSQVNDIEITEIALADKYGCPIEATVFARGITRMHQTGEINSPQGWPMEKSAPVFNIPDEWDNT